MKKILILVFSVFMVFMIGGTASALQLTLSSNGSTVTVDDLDADGVVFYNGAVGSWGVNLTAGTSDPALSGPYPHMDLSTKNIYSGSLPAANLTIQLSDLWNQDVASVLNSIGGTIGAGMSTAFNLYFDGSLQDTFGPFGTSGAFAINAITALPPISSDYTLTMEAIISTTTTGNPTSFDWELTPAVPEPATMLLVGSGLVGLAGLGRKKFSKKA